MGDLQNPLTDGEPYSVAKLNSLHNAHDQEGVLSGLGLSTGTGNFEVDVASGEVLLGGSTVSVSSDAIDHVGSDSEDRIDLITADTNGNLSRTAGSAASTSGKPNAPAIPTDEVLVGLVYVRGGATEVLSGDIFAEYRTEVGFVEGLATEGGEGTVPVAQADGSLAMSVPWGLDGVASATASSDATVEFTQNIDSTYDSYVFILSDVRDDAGSVDLQLNVSTDGGSTWDTGSGGYNVLGWANDQGTTSTSDNTSANDFALTPETPIAAASQHGLNMVIYMSEPADSSRTTRFDARGFYPNRVQTWASGQRNNTQSDNAIRFLLSDGNFERGNFHLYGVSAP